MPVEVLSTRDDERAFDSETLGTPSYFEGVLYYAASSTRSVHHQLFNRGHIGVLTTRFPYHTGEFIVGRQEGRDMVYIVDSNNLSWIPTSRELRRLRACWGYPPFTYISELETWTLPRERETAERDLCP